MGLGVRMECMVEDVLGDEVAVRGVCCNDGNDVVMKWIGTVGFLGLV